MRNQNTVDADFQDVTPPRARNSDPNVTTTFGGRPILLVVVLILALVVSIVYIGVGVGDKNSNSNKLQAQIAEMQQKSDAEAAATAQAAAEAKAAATAQATAEAKAAATAQAAAEAKAAATAQATAEAKAAATAQAAAEAKAAAELLALREEIARLKAAPVVATTSTTQQQSTIGLGEWEKTITTVAPQKVTVNGAEEFRRIFKGMSPVEKHPKFGEISYCLVRLPGDSGDRFWESPTAPPIAIPRGFSHWTTDDSGSWMVVR